MEVHILGAHVTEISSAKTAALVVDGILALDAGSLCSSLKVHDQRRLKAILITHYHYDHVKDLPMIAMNLAYHGSIGIYATSAVFEALSTHLLDGKLYPNFREWPDSQPSLRFVTVQEYERINIERYSVVAVPVPHSAPAVGFQVTSSGGKRLFYTGDAAEGLSTCWEHVSPDLLITEMSWPQEMEAMARKTTHLCPGLLRKELEEFRRIRGYVPRTVLIHLDPQHEAQLSREVAEITRELGASITLGWEGMKVTV